MGHSRDTLLFEPLSSSNNLEGGAASIVSPQAFYFLACVSQDGAVHLLTN